MAKKLKKNQLAKLKKNGLNKDGSVDYDKQIEMEFVSPEDIVIVPEPSKGSDESVTNESTEANSVEESDTDGAKLELVSDNTATDSNDNEDTDVDEDDAKGKKKGKKEKISEDFRVQKELRIAKLPKAQRNKKVKSEKDLINLIVASKKEIYAKSNKDKMLKKHKVKKVYKDEFDRIYLEKAKRMAQMILMFQEDKGNFPIEEVYWEVQNEITSLQKIYKNKKINPFQKIPEFEFCDMLVWSNRYLLEMMYDDGDYTLEFLIDDTYRIAKRIYAKLKHKNAFGAERASVELMDYLIDKYSWAGVESE